MKVQKPVLPKWDPIFCRCGATIQRHYGGFFYNGMQLHPSQRETILKLIAPEEYERQKKNGGGILDCPKCKSPIFFTNKTPLSEDALGIGKKPK